jgi:hypothetical protein
MLRVRLLAHHGTYFRKRYISTATTTTVLSRVINVLRAAHDLSLRVPLQNVDAGARFRTLLPWAIKEMADTNNNRLSRTVRIGGAFVCCICVN